MNSQESIKEPETKEPTHKSFSLWLPVDFPVDGKDLKYFIERVGIWAGKFRSTPSSKEYEKDNSRFIKIFDAIDDYYTTLYGKILVEKIVKENAATKR
jgi:hypothetical protein